MVIERILDRFTTIPGVRGAWLRSGLGSVQNRVRYGIWLRPHYAFGIYSAADLARRLQLESISAIEFGVGGGRGLIEMEHVAAKVQEATGIRIEVYGFDLGAGMPPPRDYRDLPYVWDTGYYTMDVARLRPMLKSAKLILGDVSETLKPFLTDGPPPPVGFVSFDMDYYSSTKKGLAVFDGPEATRLPRVYCYFDDIKWPDIACHNEYIGELCAIREFNEEHAEKKVCPLHLLRNMRVHREVWCDQVYVMHDFAHNLYCQNITPQSDTYTQLPV